MIALNALAKARCGASSETVGHSVHIECNLPELSFTWQTANDAVHQFDPTVVKGSDENLSDKDENGDSDEEDDQVNERHEMTNTQTVLELIHQVNAWSRFEGPES